MYYAFAHPGTVRLSGTTRKDYLQRQTSNDMDLLSPTRALPNLLTSANGRILELFTLVEDGEDLLMLTQAGHGPGLAGYFAKRIFFNDQVKVSDESAAWAQVELHGSDAAEVLAGLGFAAAPGLDEVAEASFDGARLRAIGEPGFGQPLRYRLLFPSNGADKLASRMGEAMDFATRDRLRIEAGLAGDPEFQNEYTPFELGLDALVSASKGCYTGQEVLARQVTYDKVVRQLSRVRGEQPLERGFQLLADGKLVGTISSVAGEFGLTVLRKPHHELGTQLVCRAGTQEVRVQVA